MRHSIAFCESRPLILRHTCIYADFPRLNLHFYRSHFAILSTHPRSRAICPSESFKAQAQSRVFSRFYSVRARPIKRWHNSCFIRVRRLSFRLDREIDAANNPSRGRRRRHCPVMPAAPLRRGTEGGKERHCITIDFMKVGSVFEPTMGITARTPIVIGMSISHRWKSRRIKRLAYAYGSTSTWPTPPVPHIAMQSSRFTTRQKQRAMRQSRRLQFHQFRHQPPLAGLRRVDFLKSENRHYRTFSF